MGSIAVRSWLFLLCAPVSTAQLQPMFSTPQVDFPVSTSSLAVGDLDGDGREDLVVGSSSGCAASALSSGTGIYVDPTEICVGQSTHNVLLADVNEDGALDLVTAPWNGSAVRLSLGNGDGTFAAPTTISVMSGPVDMDAGDVDGDTHLDLLLTKGGVTGTLKLYLGDGLGGFTLLPDAPDPVPFTLGALIADLDHDGDAEVFVASASGGVIYYGDGTGHFADPFWIDAAYSGDAMVADLNVDGIDDLVAHAGGGGQLVAFFGTVAGMLTGPNPVPGMEQSSRLVFADIDRDGLLDVISREGVAQAAVRRGDGQGHYGPPDIYPAGPSYGRVGVTDANDDGWPDLLIQTGTVTVRLNDGTGHFGLSLETGGPPAGITIDDFDGDGWPDLAVSREASDDIGIHLAAGAGAFQSPVVYTVGDGPRGIASADLDGDGWRDLAVVNRNSNSVSLLLNDRAGGFGSGATLPAGITPQAIGFGDFDEDGAEDLIVSSIGLDGVMVHFAPAVGGAREPFVAHTSLDPLDLVVLDVDGDEHLDAAVACAGVQTTLNVLFGDGRGGFIVGQHIDSGGYARTIAAADLDGDQLPELVAGGTQGFAEPWVSVIRWNGTGFLAPEITFVDVGPADLSLADMDADGRLDLVVLSLSELHGNSVAVFRGDGAGGWDDSASYTAGAPPTGFALADLDRDGRLDAATTSPLGVHMLLNNLPDCGAITAHGSGCPGSGGFAPALSMAGCAAQGAQVSLAIEQGLGASLALLIFGASPASVPLPSGCTLNVSPLVGPMLALPLGGTGPGLGAVTVSGLIPSNAPGLSLSIQAFVLDGGVSAGYAATNGVRFTLP